MLPVKANKLEKISTQKLTLSEKFWVYLPINRLIALGSTSTILTVLGDWGDHPNFWGGFMAVTAFILWICLVLAAVGTLIQLADGYNHDTLPKRRRRAIDSRSFRWSDGIVAEPIKDKVRITKYEKKSRRSPELWPVSLGYDVMEPDRWDGTQKEFNADTQAEEAYEYMAELREKSQPKNLISDEARALAKSLNS